MIVQDILRRKGDQVATVGPDTTVRDLLATLAEHNIGAVVVADTEGGVAGIVSERDVVRRLRSDGAALLDAPVEQIMTREVMTVTPYDKVDALTITMTTQRIRHLPVLDNGRLAGVVSIGDVVKLRIDELEGERESLIGYIGSGG